MNLEQVKAGLVWHYKNYQGKQSASDRVKYSDAGMEARRHSRELWADPDPAPPRGHARQTGNRRKP
jgi:endonuclease YncB( thermonuclease family)